MSKKNLGGNSLKCWVFVKIELLDKNLTFRIVCNICVYAHYLNYSFHSNPDFLEKLVKETCLEYILPWKLLLLLSLIRKVKKTAQNPQNEWWKFSRECCLSVGPNASVLWWQITCVSQKFRLHFFPLLGLNLHLFFMLQKTNNEVLKMICTSVASLFGQN